jgi:oxidase EvaA
MNNIDINAFLLSWACKNGNVNKTDDILREINKLNEETFVQIEETSIYNNDFWFYDDYNGEVLNRKRSFFSIKGMRQFVDGEFVCEQPIIVQPEIGYLGIVCKKIDGILNFLMQYKIEPGNVNCVQISPTIQATKSNFTRAHGGKLPAYFGYFENAARYDVVYDQVQSEQAARFYKKRNRNIIIQVEEEIPVFNGFTWMTLGQIKELMKIDNLVNMDTRTVISGIPFSLVKSFELKKDSYIGGGIENELLQSMFSFDAQNYMPSLFQKMNNYKMFNEVKISTVPIYELVDWKVDEYGITCKRGADFSVRYYTIEIAGREVRKWFQPLFKAMGSATFGLICRIKNGKYEYLVKIRPEIGSFDKIEIGPTIQWESTHSLSADNKIDKLFRSKMNDQNEVLRDIILSEEGGRFYHEQNRNMVIKIDTIDIDLLSDYCWVDYYTLNLLIQTNNNLNIQLRNLLSIL